jgi:hypothetical protein
LTVQSIAKGNNLHNTHLRTSQRYLFEVKSGNAILDDPLLSAFAVDPNSTSTFAVPDTATWTLKLQLKDLCTDGTCTSIMPQHTAAAMSHFLAGAY